MIGLKCAEGICERVKQITVCDLAPRILSNILDDECAAMLQRCPEDHGIEFLLSDTVTEFKGQTAVMKSGKDPDFDVLANFPNAYMQGKCAGMRCSTGAFP